MHNGTINSYVLFISGNHVIENDFRSSDRVKEVNAIAENCRGRKLLRISRFCGKTLKFLEILGVASFGVAKTSNPRKFSAKIVCFPLYGISQLQVCGTCSCHF